MKTQIFLFLKLLHRTAGDNYADYWQDGEQFPNVFPKDHFVLLSFSTTQKGPERLQLSF
ncbi:hypothetical protein KKH15_03245 [Patescibacteria group bacterium]|nr:hypothetical protein [Patescibacteria group bacterium]MBU1755270.1 hypothetical protein [Patescibacteria group bacterium]